MQTLNTKINTWTSEGKKLALATLVKVSGSAPRPLGSKMLVSSAGDMVGSVSGGCVEGNVFEVAQSVLPLNYPRLVEYGIADEQAFEIIGLACGGNIQVFVEPLNAAHRALAQPEAADWLVVSVTVLSGLHIGQYLLIHEDGTETGTLIDTELLAQIRSQVGKFAAPARLTLIDSQERKIEVFIEPHLPPPQLIIIGAVHIAVPLITFAAELGFKTVVIDARAAFATRQRFPHADELRVAWPAEALTDMNLNRSSCVVFLSHDQKMDNPALAEIVKHPVGYIGVLGSPKTHMQRITALKRMGVSDEQLARIRAPIGLDLGGRRAEEIAVSIIAQIVAVRNGKEVR